MPPCGTDPNKAPISKKVSPLVFIHMMQGEGGWAETTWGVILIISALGSLVLTYKPSGRRTLEMEMGNFRILNEFPKVQDRSLLHGMKSSEIP